MKKFNLPLTYEPKIRPVIDGTCRQTIRTGRKFSDGDLVSFHGWEGRPYHSSWSFRTPYQPLTDAVSCEIYDAGMWVDPMWCEKISEIKLSGKFWWSDLDWLAALDGIVPATGNELKTVLSGKNNLSNCKGIEAQIIRW